MNILLVCACGASTTIVVEAMKENLHEDEKDWFIEAKSVQEVKDCIGKYDAILVAPQIRYRRMKSRLLTLIQVHMAHAMARKSWMQLENYKIILRKG